MIFTIKLFPLIFLSLGLFVLIQVGTPLVNFKLWEMGLRTPSLVSPQQGSVQGLSIKKSAGNFPALISQNNRPSQASFNQASISIPSIGIEEAVIYIDSNDLTKGLAHLPGSALPGEKGNMFVSGHSALPQLFNGGKSYGSIFANLNKVKKGEIIKVKVGKGEFKYQILGMKVVSPENLSIINPPDLTGRYISLMTCVPPGLNTKRLVVLGKLVE